MNNIVFIDTEVNPQTEKLLDFGAVKPDGVKFHGACYAEFSKFIAGSEYICGHNIISHDLKYISRLIPAAANIKAIDTLYLSPLLFPAKPYHALLKDDKLQTDELNNPLNDSVKAMELFYDEINAFARLNSNLKFILFSLLNPFAHFTNFFKYVNYAVPENLISASLPSLIKTQFEGEICANAPLEELIQNSPAELAYCLALFSVKDRYSLTPAWVHKNFPRTFNVIKLLRNTPCGGCAYCESRLNVKTRLKSIYGYDNFRTYEGKSLQEDAAKAAVNGNSLLAVFPTGGGKSVTFQLPALIAGETSRALTVVISPLQSLMKDQVDNLSALGIVDAVTVNGMLSDIERSEAYERVESGLASILYISPESLRSASVERLLLARNVARFVIDEAHCFSSWGQDFRVDYLFIGDFIKNLIEKKNLSRGIPVSCFTATAKQKVISDIKDYFKSKLDIELDLYATNAARENLHYAVLYKETDEEKYVELRRLISHRRCPTIVYVSRIKRTQEIAKRLTLDGFPALPFNGQMESAQKVINQESFISGKTDIIVATSAFGMGVDKKDVKLVVHYDISDSLENYVQEAGRAGRDQNINADCYVLFNDNDLDKHFILLNQTKLSISEIQQVWRAIKDLTKRRSVLYRSPLEIARQAGWDDTRVNEIETRVKTAISALETAGYIKRGKNSPRIFATSILAKTMAEASEMINASEKYNEAEKQTASRIMSRLISSRSGAKAGNSDAESRVDYLSDILGIPTADVISSVSKMREQGLLADSRDLTAYIRRGENENKSLQILQRYAALEEFLITQTEAGTQIFNLKEINGRAQDAGLKSSTVKSIRTLLYYWTIKGYIKKVLAEFGNAAVIPEMPPKVFKRKCERRIDIAGFIVKYLFELSKTQKAEDGKDECLVLFSVLELKMAYDNELSLFKIPGETTTEDVQDALLYLSKIESLTLEGGFLVLYNTMQINRIEKNNKVNYKAEDYKKLSEYYKNKIQQIHIVGEYANMMVKNYNEALNFVDDYFRLDYRKFISKYFKGNRICEIDRSITPEKYEKIYGNLSGVQEEIIKDTSKYIVVAAGPGSGKTRVLAHKIAALMMMEEVKSEQLLMLTFTRSAAIEFKKRVHALIENASRFIEIKTFHSYCFDLLGKVGNLKDSDNVVGAAVNLINSGEAEISGITKTVVVIDEAQDMDEDEYALICALMDKNEEMRVIAVGDDDQNIFEYRGSSSKYMQQLITEKGAAKYEMLENYRSKTHIVGLANAFVKTLNNRMKVNPIVPAAGGDNINSAITVRSLGTSAQAEANGVVTLYKHAGKNLEIPVVNNLKETYTGKERACVLTCTNEEALKVTGLLIKEGYNARLIQENSGFNLYDLAEFRYLFKVINKETQSPIISDEIWEAAKTKLETVYAQSSCLDNCLNLLEEFERGTKYKADLEILIRESKFEDFYKFNDGEIVVSTIHKAKGREFDSVYLLISNGGYYSQETRRQIYVGLTRAKNKLFVHYNNGIFDSVKSEGAVRITDNNIYPEPDEITAQLTHRDIYLNFFKSKREIIRRLISGQEVKIEGNTLYIETPDGPRGILVFSKKYREDLTALAGKGYNPYKAKVRFVTAWKGKDDEEENVIFLPDIYYKKNFH